MSSNDLLADKKRIFELIDIHKFDDALDLTDIFLTKKSNSESTFRIGAKTLGILLNIRQREHLKAVFPIFNKWFDFCLEFKQTLLTKNNIIYHAVMFTKNLMTEKLFEMALNMLKKLQSIYTFLCDNKYDAESEKYIKYMAPLTYNQSINKELINQNPEVAMHLFIHGVKFYAKLLTNFFTVYDSIRIYEFSFIKNNQFEYFYDAMFTFFYDSLNDKDCLTAIESKVTLSKEKKLANTDHDVKQVYLLKCHLMLFVHYLSVCYSNDNIKTKEKIAEYYSKLKLCFQIEANQMIFKAKRSLKHDDGVNLKELEIYVDVFNLIDLILNYSDQFKKKTCLKSSKTATTTIVHILKENLSLEHQLKTKFSYLMEKSTQTNTFYGHWLLNNLFDMFMSATSAYLSDQAIASRYLQDSLIDMMVTLGDLFSENVKKYQATHHDTEKIQKYIFIKPIILFSSTEKLIEHLIKTNNQSKSENSQLLTDSCERLLKNHVAYINWLDKTKSLGNEDLTKNFFSIENQGVRLGSLFYSEETMPNYIRFQKVSLHISVQRLKFIHANCKGSTIDSNLMKNARSIGENLLLSLRLKENFDETRQVLKEIYDIFCELNIEKEEMEWITMNWCKIKRDLWKLKSTTLKKLTVTEFLDIKSDLGLYYLFEEIRIYHFFKSIDSSVAMNDEIYYILEKLNNLTTNDDLLRCRIQLEIAQFNWNSYRKEDSQFGLTSEEYIENATNILLSHSCGNDVMMISEDYNKENDNNENATLNLSNNSKKRLSSPSGDIIIIEDMKNDETTKRLINKRRKLASNEQSPVLKTKKHVSKSTKTLSAKNKKPVSDDHLPSNQSESLSHCDCLTSKIVSFQLSLFKMLIKYSNYRNIMFQNLTNLIQSRMKIKDTTTVTTNADNLHLQTVASQFLICPELCDENELKMSDDVLIKNLDSCFDLLEAISNSIKLKDTFLKLEKTLIRQFYETIDLLAQLYGFFGMLTYRAKTLHLKLKLIYLDYDKCNQTTDSPFATTVINLMKSYLNANMCDEYDTLNKQLIKECEIIKENQILLERNLGTPSRTPCTVKNTKSVDNSNSSSGSVKKIKSNTMTTTVTTPTTSLTHEDGEYDLVIEKHKLISEKPETLVAYYLTLAHYYILRHNPEEAFHVMKKKIQNSAILTGKQTAYYYEVKYYYKYLQFLLSMLNLGTLEDEYQRFLECETPLSLIEDCYTSSFSVARFYMQNSVEPSRAISTTIFNNKAPDALKTSKQDENIFFDIGNSECYRILSECLDLMNWLCKYYVDISRYRDATGYIKEALDITQLHFSSRRIGSFLLQQVNADLIASCLNEASSRIKITENLLGFQEIDIQKKLSTHITDDTFKFKSYLTLLSLVAYKNSKLNVSIKKSKSLGTSPDIDSKNLIKTGNLVKTVLSENVTLHDFCKDQLVELSFLICNDAKQVGDRENILKFLKIIKNYLVTKPTDVKRIKVSCSLEKWYLAEYYCFLFELDEANNKSFLYLANDFIKQNPHPTLYRRICFNMFKVENESKQKIGFLLESQSIALRHKICSIQIKHKRKSNIDANIFEKLISTLSFNGSLTSKDFLTNFTEKILPSNCVVVSLVLIDTSDLYIVRLEQSNDPFLFKLKYNQKYSEEFKAIMLENDKSMKLTERSKFWSTRSSLNKRLCSFLEELESNVFSYAKSLLLGSYVDLNLNTLINSFKRDLKMETITKKQKSVLKLLFLGIEHLTADDLHNALKSEFNEKQLEQYINYFMSLKIQLSMAQRKHVCLLTDKNLHQIPWECLPSTKNQSISRMPSIHFLSSHIQINSLKINKDNAYYIVDPGSDLTHTREKFQSFFEKKTKWNGIIGVAPNENQFKKALTEYDLFIYTGHGSGSQYFPSDDVQKLRVQACSILMGCSSGNQYVMGDFEPYGTILAYILAGCPCIVGNLWDVTDRDIDRLTEDFLDSWTKDNETSDISDEVSEKLKINESFDKSTICVHLTKARKACKMSYLNGSAPIVYGLPVKFK